MTSRFSNKEKADAARREVGKRRRVYPRLVGAGTMSQRLADEQIAVMEEIAADYEALDAKDRPQLF